MFTPKRPDATCLIFERRSSPKRTGSSPPSPVFERPPIRFIATASVSCASRESEPSDIAPVEKRLTISEAGSTSSSGIAAAVGVRKRSRPRIVERRAASSLTAARVLLVRLRSRRRRTACCSSAIVSGFHWWCSPSRAPRVEADDRQQLVGGARDRRARAARALPRRARGEADAADPRRRAGEVPVDELRSRARPPRRSARRSTTGSSRCPSSRSSSAGPCRSP